MAFSSYGAFLMTEKEEPGAEFLGMVNGQNFNTSWYGNVGRASGISVMTTVLDEKISLGFKYKE